MRTLLSFSARRLAALAAAVIVGLATLVSGTAGAQSSPFVAYGMGLDPGAEVAAYVDARLCGDTVADADGNWVLYISAAAPCSPTEGDEVTFTLDGLATTAEVEWTSGGTPPDIASGITLELAGSGAAAPGGFLSGLVPGVNIAVWSGGHVEQLVEAAEAEGAASVWTVLDGEWAGFIPGAPAFLNADFRAAFPGGVVDANQPFVVVVED